LIEWPERLGFLVPARRLEIALSAGPTPAARRAAIDPGADWVARIDTACVGMSRNEHPQRA
jgi:tRNA threonylcarbamoyladenosine biosynthesis protein TsaE